MNGRQAGWQALPLSIFLLLKNEAGGSKFLLLIFFCRVDDDLVLLSLSLAGSVCVFTASVAAAAELSLPDSITS